VGGGALGWEAVEGWAGVEAAGEGWAWEGARVWAEGLVAEGLAA
jgi:hypothetical protein